MDCPQEDSLDWIYVVGQVGYDNAMQMFAEYENEPNPEQAMADAIRPANYSNSAKETYLRNASEKLTKNDKVVGDDGETYRTYLGPDGQVFKSVSEALDAEKATAYQGQAVGTKYADSGTVIHKIWERIIDEKLSLDSLITLFPNISESYLKSTREFITKLESTGTVLTEIQLSHTGINNIAGTADIIHLKNNGQVDVYDIKTAHQTSEHKKYDLWDITDFDGYKGRRYSTQIMMYADMVGKTLGQPVKNMYILPAEVLYKDPLADDLQISEVNFLPPENIESYDFIPRAQRIVDKLLVGKIKSVTDLAGTNTNEVDTILEAITRIPAAERRRERSKVAKAKGILNNPDKPIKNIDGTEYYWNPSRGKYIPFNSKDQGERLNQVMAEAVELGNAPKVDLLGSILAFIKKGKDALIGSKERNLQKMAEEYKFSNFEAEDITTLDGYEDYSGWIVMRNGDRVDLLFAGSENLNYKLSTKNKHLLSNLNKNAKARYKGQIDNDMSELKAMEGTIIALKLLKDNPDTTIGRLGIYSNKDLSHPLIVNWNRFLDVLTAVEKNKDTSGEAQAQLSELLKVDRARFKKDYLATYMEYTASYPLIETHTGVEIAEADKNRGKRLTAAITGYQDGRFQKTDLMKQLFGEIGKLMSITPDNRTESQKKELEVLSFAYMQLKDVDVMDKPLKKWASKWQSLNLQGGSILEFINKTIFGGKQKMSGEYFKFADNKKTQILKYFKSAGYNTINPKDLIFGQTTRFYESLFQKKTLIDADGKDVTVNAYRLLHEDSAEFKAQADLNPQFKIFHEYVKNSFTQAAEQAGIKNWDPYQMPLVKSTLTNSLYRWANTKENNLQDTAKLWWDQLGDNLEFTNSESDESGIFELHDRFAMQTNQDMRDEILGISEGEIIDVTKYNSFETNLDKVMDLFFVNSLRVKHMNESNQVLGMGYLMYGHLADGKFGKDYAYNQQAIEDLQTILIHGKGLNSGEPLDKVVTAINRATSFSTIAGNIRSALTVFLGQEFLVMSRALANTFAGNDFFTIRDSANAMRFMGANHKLTDKIIDKLGLQDADSTSLTNGVRSVGNRSVLSQKLMFSLFRAGDRITKGQIAIAQMIKDGSIKAYSLDENGELKYDEDLDPRFKDKTNNRGEILKQTLKLEMAEEGLLDENGKMTMGYDLKMQRRILMETAILFGTYDREMVPTASQTTLGKLFFMHKRFFPSIYFRMFSGPVELEALGRRVETVDENDEIQFVWEAGMHEGVFMSMLAGLKWLRDLRSSDRQALDTYQQENLKRLMSDMIVLSSAAAFTYGIAQAMGDDDEKAWAKTFALVMTGAQRDLLVAYDSDTLFDVFSPVAVEVTYTRLKQLFNSFHDGPEDVAEELLNLPAVTRQLNEFRQDLQNSEQ